MIVSNEKRGFTLVELILSILIISAIFVVMAQILTTGLDSYRLVVNRREALQGVRLAVNMMEGELQTIADPATEIGSITSTSMQFTNAGGQSVTYSISGSDLLRNSKVLANNVGAASGFSYYTSGGSTTTDPAQVYRIDIVVEVDAEEAQFGSVEAHAGVFLRNRYYDSYTKN
ncbi:MAG: prepilin-type N-terminal cleavage/methylation domain-containing protein [Deltaproteobacteria bacterium]|jgi:prepilin-type N-terminal cleavage/methylation domain-containing protein|nr:prepilin-type N-terminal cleavage/methylation domain-containing protein [Deltaproteobacteria bacterium]